MRRGKNDSVNVGTLEGLRVAVDERKFVRATEILGAGACTRTLQYKANLVALAGHGSNERAAPTAQSHNSGADHGLVAITATHRARARRRGGPMQSWDRRAQGYRGNPRPSGSARRGRAEARRQAGRARQI